jgi:hypothetical protein
MGLRAKFHCLSALLCMAAIGDSRRRLSRLRSFFRDSGFAQAVDEVLRSGDQGVSVNQSPRNQAAG